MNENTYSTSEGGSFWDRATLAARKKMYGVLSGKVDMDSISSVLDVGVTADRDNDFSNFFEKLYPYPERITALSDQDASWMAEVYKGLTFVKGNALYMPFADNSFALVFSNAVIEHVGSRKNQAQLIKECIRVSRRYVFITTPNRYYPLELHTGLPFFHWLSANAYRCILRILRKNFFALEENLNLLSRRELNKIAMGVSKEFQIEHIRFMGFKSNFLLIIDKKN